MSAETRNRGPVLAPQELLEVRHEVPGGLADVRQLRARLKELTLKLSNVFREFPKVDNGRVASSTELVRRRLLTSEKTWTDERRSRIRIDVLGETIAEDGQHLSASLAFHASDMAGLPPLAPGVLQLPRGRSRGH